MLSPDVIGGTVGGFVAGAGAMLGFMRSMIRGAMRDLELRLTEKYDKRYLMLPQREERA